MSLRPFTILAISRPVVVQKLMSWLKLVSASSRRSGFTAEMEVLSNLKPFVHLVFAVEADADIVGIGANQNAGVVTVTDGETALEFVGTVVEGGAVALIERIAAFRFGKL